MIRTIKTGRGFRTLALDRAKMDEENRSIPLSFSSEEPYERFFGTEILDHGNKSVRLDRLKNNGPLLFNHDPNRLLGTTEEVSIGTDRRGRAVVRFGKSALAEEKFQEVLDGVLKSVSVGYLVHKMVLEEEDEGKETWRVLDWEPLEVSIVSIPADTTVGIGRDADYDDHETLILEREVKTMKNCEHCKRSLGAEETCNCKTTPAPTPPAPVAPVVDVGAAREEAAAAERTRAAEITALAKLHRMDDLGTEHVNKGTSLEDFRGVVLERLGNLKPVDIDPEIGLSKKEIKSFRLTRLLNSLANPNDMRAREAAAFELEASSEAAKHLQKEARGVVIPHDIMRAPVEISSVDAYNRVAMAMGRRDLLVGTATAGGHTVATDLLASSFIDLLNNAMQVRALGATILSDLVGNVAIPRQTSGATMYWVAENAAPTESQQAFDQVTLSPTTAAAYTDFARRLLIQSSIDVEAFVRRDLAVRIALGVDLAAINGSGASNQPTGILNVTGIGDVAIGTNGGAPTYAHIVSIWKEVAQDNASLGALGWLTNAIMIAKLAQTEKASSTAQFIIPNLPGSDGMTNLVGMRAAMSNQVPSTLTKGTSTDCSAIIFGNWADLLIGEWSGLDILVDPYTGSTAGTVRVTAHQDIDVAVRHPESFAATQDARDV